jgi:hypothetical protein
MVTHLPPDAALITNRNKSLFLHDQDEGVIRDGSSGWVMEDDENDEKVYDRVSPKPDQCVPSSCQQ